MDHASMIERVASARYAVKVAVSQQGITNTSSLWNKEEKIKITLIIIPD